MNNEDNIKLLARLYAHELVIRDLLVLRFIGAPDPIKALEVFGANLAPTTTAAAIPGIAADRADALAPLIAEVAAAIVGSAKATLQSLRGSNAPG
jgi:hypothetical protein